MTTLKKEFLLRSKIDIGKAKKKKKIMVSLKTYHADLF